MSAKKIIIGAGIIAIAGYFFIEYKVQKIIERFQFVKVYPTAIKKFNIKWNEGSPFVSFNLDIKLVNPTPEVFSAKIVAVKLKRIIFYDKNNILLGTATVNTDAITIPANGSTTLFDIPIQLELKTIASTIISAIQNSFNLKDIRIESVVSILGTEHKI
ncbi:hypothetical protein C8C83_2822 [Flavobacterium sp. 90]|uniref:hypothetical protein n=1 Tax=unclassified Flavobacterium TaxID=196869 RepID=UPI000EABBF3E|nr:MULTISPECIES: hypothetical protein [unclassified Flavobacterium]RKR11124.1 hypothetical protein C8C82_3130 [Flavobacterium sp. 81]TCK54907.1 hypothetical protein C8C83_2822 [Flavobacterium sp. 90]